MAAPRTYDEKLAMIVRDRTQEPLPENNFVYLDA